MHDPAYVEEAVARARRKIEGLRSGGVVPRPAGRFRDRLVAGTLLLLLGALALGVAVAALVAAAQGQEKWDTALALAAALALLGLLPILPGLYLVTISRASSPENAVILFFRCVAGFGGRKAREIVVPNDRDDFPRDYPPALAHGEGLEIGSPDGFAAYWKGLLRRGPLPICRARVSNLEAREIGLDLAIVDFDLTVTRTTGLWLLSLLLLFVPLLPGLGPLVCLAGMRFTRHRDAARMRKILWRVGDEWHLFNGEWEGPEERGIAWLAPETEDELPPPPAPSADGEAIRRALRKASLLRSGNVFQLPAGPFWTRIRIGAYLALGGLVFPGIVIPLLPDGWTRRDDAKTGLAIALGMCALLLAPGLRLILTSTATTPMRALRVFYKAVARGEAGFARRVVVPIDFDRFPRRYPNVPELGFAGSPPYAFAVPGAFDEYWNGLLRYPGSPYCLVRIRDLEVREAAPGFLVADFRLKLTINTVSWYFLCLLGLFPVALLLDVLTRKRVDEPMRKILVRVGTEWLLFNGEWQGAEERDTGWLEAPGGGGR